MYASTPFSGPFAFDEISFMRGSSGLMDSATYTVDFSYTTAQVNGLSSVNANDNIGLDETLFGTYTLSGSMPAVLTLSGNTFDHDPSIGNLLMTVNISNLTASHGYQSFFEADDSGTVTSRAYFGHFTSADAVGLVADFTPSTSAVPEPASPALLGSGLVGLAARYARRRRKNTAV